MILSFPLLPNLSHISMLTFSIKSLIVITISFFFLSILLIEEDHIKSTKIYTLYPLKLLTHPLFPLDMPTKLNFFPFFFPTNFPNTLNYGNILPSNATTLGLKLAFITSLMDLLPDSFYNTLNLCFSRGNPGPPFKIYTYTIMGVNPSNRRLRAAKKSC